MAEACYRSSVRSSGIESPDLHGAIHWLAIEQRRRLAFQMAIEERSQVVANQQQQVLVTLGILRQNLEITERIMSSAGQ